VLGRENNIDKGAKPWNATECGFRTTISLMSLEILREEEERRRRGRRRMLICLELLSSRGISIRVTYLYFYHLLTSSYSEWGLFSCVGKGN
jgi:hypothetical protein